MRWNLSNLVVVLSFGVLSMTYVASAVCASTPAAAVHHDETNGGQVIEGHDGYRVTSVRWDPVLRQEWVMVMRCGHPEWPEIALPTRLSSRALNHETEKTLVRTVAPVVGAGDKVRLWEREDALQIETVAVAEDSCGMGERIRVRLAWPGMESQERQMFGVVRGTADVEMQR